MIGGVIDTAHQGNRYGFQALQRVIDWVKSTNQVVEIQGWRHPNNRPSKATMEKLGMEEDLHAVPVPRYFPILNETRNMEVWRKKL
jgi:RimJ/RimL family protein N-acetyltransferase